MLNLVFLFTALGLVATFAAPWYELRGAFAAWRIVEWHTFWRGDSAFQLASVVASDYRVPVEYATVALQDTLRAIFAIGGALGVWHIAASIVLLIAGSRMRLRAGASRSRVALEVIVLVAVNALALALLAWLLALPSSITTKVDFRSAGEIHTDTLIWSDLNLFPIAPVLAIVSAVAQVGAEISVARGFDSRQH